MLEEPPKLQMKKADRRPSEAQIAALRDQPTGFICDALDGKAALDPGLTLLDPQALPDRFCGVALTADCGPDDILALQAALTQIRPGDVIVASTRDWRGSAVTGDRVLGMCRNSGAVAFVTDGLVRDYEGIVEVGLPVVCAGMTPNSPYAKGPGKVGTGVVVGGVAIATGDIVLGDRTGTVVIPFEKIDQVVETVARVAELEDAMDAKVAEGQKSPPAMQDLVASDKVKWL